MWISLGNHASLALIFAQTDPELRHKGIACFLVETEPGGLPAAGDPRARWACTAPTPPRSRSTTSSRPDDSLLGAGRRRLQGRDERAGLGPLLAWPPAASGICQGCARRVGQVRQGARAVRPADRVVPARAGDDRRDGASRPTRRGCSSGAPGWLKDTGQPNTTETSIAKLFATEAAVWCANEAIQVHGGAGYVDDHPVERYFRDVRVTTLYEGTSQIQKLIIGRAADGHQRARPAALRVGRRRRRRRHDGRGHRAARRASRARGRCCTTPSREALEARGRAGARAGCDKRRRARRSTRRRGRRRASALQRRGALERRSRGCDARHRGGARAPRAQARAVRARLGAIGAAAACWPRTPPRSRSPRSPRGAADPSRVVGHALLQPARRVMELVEVIAGLRVLGRGAGASRARARRGDGQARHRRRRRPRLPRQPLQPPFGLEALALAAGAASPTSRRSTAIVRARRRLPHGPVRAAGPRRASTSASRSRSPSPSSASASRAGARRR